MASNTPFAVLIERLFLLKGIRKLIKKRQNVENTYKRRDVIEDYKNYGSEAYAPLTRHGYFPDRNSENYVVKNRYLDTYQGNMRPRRQHLLEVFDNVRSSCQTQVYLNSKRLCRPTSST